MSNKSFLRLAVQIAIKNLDKEEKVKSLKISFFRSGSFRLTGLTGQLCPVLYLKIFDELKLIARNYQNVIINEICNVDYEVLSNHQILEIVKALMENEK